MKRLWRSALSLAIGLCFSIVPSASAAPITLGAPLATTSFAGGFGCGAAGGCTFEAFILSAGHLAVSPVDGTIVSWSIKGASATPGFAIRVLSRSGTSLTGIATSGPRTPAGTGVETFAVNLAIKKGQSFGLNVPQGGNLGYDTTASEAKFGVVLPALADNATKANASDLGGELAFSAQVQPTPTIAVLGVTSGPIGGGTSVLIAGSDFEGTTSVKFGAVPAPFSVTSENTIVTTSPPSAVPGPVPLTVTTIAGTAASAQQFLYTASAPPAPSCRVPKLKGKVLKSAKKRIRAADCSVGKLTKRKGATAKTGEVVRQIPKPGAVVPTGTKVKVTLGA